MSSIQLRDLRVSFRDGTFGLQDINLKIEPEEFVVLIGPSGSGKTTMLRTIAGFVEPTSGSVLIGGEDMTHVPPERRRMGMVFQQHAVWPHMSVAKNVGYPLARNGEKGASISFMLHTRRRGTGAPHPGHKLRRDADGAHRRNHRRNNQEQHGGQSRLNGLHRKRIGCGQALFTN